MASDTSSPTTNSSGPWNNKLLLDEFRAAMRLEHNKHRADHGSGPLQLNDTLNGYAQYWANVCAEMEDAVHRGDPDYDVGENLYANWFNDTTVGAIAAEVCKEFYDEIFAYDFKMAMFSEETPHFTQLIWYDTNELGVGIAIGETGRVYCVVNYTPQGNVTGGFRSNVLPINTEYKPKPKLIDQSVFIPPTVTRLNKGTNMNIFRELLTNQHNIYRKHHSVPFLHNTDSLNYIAQKWAEHCAEHDELMHSENGYGENIFVSLSDDSTAYYPSVLEICKSFKAQEDQYRYDEDTDHTALHFTQMIWKDSQEIGIGVKKASSGKVYVVCFYNPPGNISGEYTKNVFRFNSLPVAPIKVDVTDL